MRNWNGMNWIRQDKRLAIYLRDGLACAYCSVGVETGAQMTLDHVTPHSHGGSNEATNLVTCCKRCNTARGTRDVTEFAAATAHYLNHDVKADEIVGHVLRQIALDLKGFRVEAKVMIARRGSAARVLAEITN